MDKAIRAEAIVGEIRRDGVDPNLPLDDIKREYDFEKHARCVIEPVDAGGLEQMDRGHLSLCYSVEVTDNADVVAYSCVFCGGLH